MTENPTMEVDEDIEAVKNGETKSNRKARDARGSLPQSRKWKRIVLSLTRPSYTLTTGSENVRVKNRAGLRRLLSRLVRRHNWEEASGVLSVLLKGTGSEKSPMRNRTKYWLAMELLKHIKSDPINSTKIQHVYEIWMKRIGSMDNWPIKDRFVVQLEFILFCLRQGNAEDAHQAALCVRGSGEHFGSHCLMQQQEFGSDPIANMVVGLTFSHLWYSTIPKELWSRDSDESYTSMQSEMDIRLHVPIENSKGHNTVDIHEDDSSFHADSETSVRNDKNFAQDVDVDQHSEVFMEVNDNLYRETTYKNHQSQGFYMNSADDSGQEKSFSSNHDDNMQYASTFNAKGEFCNLLAYHCNLCFR
ncbi:hypothetical protein U1Q18_024916 [Sarracenia purpurea var. burkii]